MDMLRYITNFLSKNGWTLKSSNSKFNYYKPPSELGFESNYTLPVPILSEAEDHNEYINYTAKVIAEIYETNVDDLFYDTGDYLSILKKKAEYYKLESSTIKYGKLLALNNVWGFLKSLNLSFKNYVRVEANKQFGSILNKKSYDVLEQVTQPRFVDLKLQSFSFGLSTDTVMSKDKIEIKRVEKWTTTIFKDYNDKIFESDFMLDDTINEFKEKYTLEERKRIFKPLFDSINDDDYYVSKTNKNYSILKRIRPVKKEIVKEIIPPIIEEQKKENFELYYTPIAISDSNKKVVVSTEDLKNDLFAKQIDHLPLTLDGFKYKDTYIPFNKELTVNVSFKDNTYLASIDDLSIDVLTKDRNTIKSQLQLSIAEKFQIYRNNKYDDSTIQDPIDIFFDKYLEDDYKN